MREIDFLFGWFAHPVTYGDYPEVMKSLVGERLPKFAKRQSDMPKGSLDFLGSEGAALIDGRGPSIWDTFVREQSEKIKDRSTGDVADDLYHRYKEDIKLMKKIGLDSFRFSISWSRILPKGKISGGVNPLSVQFYNDLINNLLSNGIKPFVTLLHFDPPQALEDEYGGFLSPQIVKDYVEYADFCFKTFGDRVKLWVTINEPNTFVIQGYDSGVFAPGRCSHLVGNCSAGNSATEPYIVMHHLLLSHSAAVKLYRDKYEVIQKGQIGITIASQWIAHPITYGSYRRRMRELVGSRMPKFTQEQSKMIKGSFDFITLDYCTTFYAENAPLANGAILSYTADQRVNATSERNGVPIGTPTVLSWLYIYPKGLEELLLYVKENYNNPTIFITENGMADDASLPLEVGLKDGLRIRYLSSHLSYLLRAIKEGVNVKSYYIWSFFDDFEWSNGYTFRFGITYVDYKNNLKRYLKYSAYWFKLFLAN
ncbi:hypothetical protein JCGZ_01628 [Jatropha curcas]|uniref:Uncharacterized protein n=1 Tax=Jatropha curcas TaxID=180498 RepID=A0A067LE04_JATCU|nr:hypothetical protein JCGZ_01628 [Jatropha curcas]